MAQDINDSGGNSFELDNVTFPTARAKLNTIFDAVRTNNSGTSAPTTQYAGQFWIDTTSTTWTLYIHDGTDDIPFCTIDTSANTVNFTDSALDVVTDTTPQLGGNLDLNSNDITGTGNINITGNITASGNLAGTLTTASQPNITSVGTLTGLTTSGDINFGNNDKAVFGASNDLKIYHTGTDSIIEDVGTGELEIRSNGTGILLQKDSSEYLARFLTDGACELYSDSALRLATTSTGVNLYNQGTTNVDLELITGAINDRSCSIKFTSASGGNVRSKIESDHYNNLLRFYHNDATSERFRIDSSGNLDMTTGGGNIILASGAGIDFSATANSSGTMSSELLDDYEEGTWTPTYTAQTDFTSVTYDSRTAGTYVKIGKLVTVTFAVVTDALSGGSGNVSVSNLPFTNQSVSGEPEYSALSIGWATNFGGDYPTSGIVSPGGTKVELTYRTAVNGATSYLQASDMGTTGNDNLMYGSLMYYTA